MGCVGKEPVPNDSLNVLDGSNDFIYKGSGAIKSLIPVDIQEVIITNDGQNLIVSIKTRAELPSKLPRGPEPDYYGIGLMITADYDGNKYGDVGIYVDNQGISVEGYIEGYPIDVPLL